MWIETLLAKLDPFVSKDFFLASFLPVLIFSAAVAVTLAAVVGFPTVWGYFEGLTLIPEATLLAGVSLLLVSEGYVANSLRIIFLKLWTGEIPFLLLGVSPVLGWINKKRRQQLFKCSNQQRNWAEILNWVQSNSFPGREEVIKERAHVLYLQRNKALSSEEEQKHDYFQAQSEVDALRLTWENFNKDFAGQLRTMGKIVEEPDRTEAIKNFLRTRLHQLSPMDRRKAVETIQAKVDKEMTEIAIAKARLHREFGKGEHTVKPTRLGNIVESFLAYPYVRYRMEADAFWPRLQYILKEDSKKATNEARVILDFSLTMATLSAFYGILVTFGLPWLWPDLRLLLPLVSASALLTWGFYRLSIVGAEQYGEHFRASFDLFRLDLLHSLHGKHPNKLSIERKSWESLSQLIIYGEAQDSDLEIRARSDAT